MRYLTLRNTSRATVLGTRVAVADTFISRLRGLRGRVLEPDEGLLLVPCRCVHTFGMKTPLDLVFLDRKGIVVDLQEHVPPQRVSSWKLHVRSVLELPPGTIRSSHTREGDRLSWSGSAHGCPTLKTPEVGHDHC